MPNKNHRQLRSRTTRSSKPRLLTDPTSSTQLLTTQLQSLGLYAAHTIGDGNCLFRALSDQVHGSPEKHRDVRKQVCDWIEQHKERYEGFVEDDDYVLDDPGTKAGKKSRDKGKGLEAHLRCMRENATYGGHMELSAFAHLSKRNIKVIQPGLVYVIEWQAGDSSPSSSAPQDQVPHPERRRSKRTHRPPLSPSKSQDESKQIVKIGTGKHGYYVYEEISDSEEEDEVEESLKPDCGDESGGDTVYVAYHDWEHFSSIRNLRGPHAGLPHVRESPAQSVLREREALKDREREKDKKKKEVIKVKLKIPSSSLPQPITASTSLSSLSSCSSLTSIGTATNADPTMIPLPNSRSVSPLPPTLPITIPIISPPIPATPTLTSSSINNTIIRSSTNHQHLHLHQYQHQHQHRSPKRTFDESSASGEDGDGNASAGSGREKRSRVGGEKSRLGTESGGDVDNMDVDVDVDVDTPGLSAPGSSSSSSETGSDSSSDLTSPSPPPLPAKPSPPTSTAKSPPTKSPKSKPGIHSNGNKPLTRRQRKALGLPKSRPPLPPSSSSSSGKIIIPGGKWKGRQQDQAVGVVEGGEGGGDEEWRRNGNGRVDVRGFRELKI